MRQLLVHPEAPPPSQDSFSPGPCTLGKKPLFSGIKERAMRRQFHCFHSLLFIAVCLFLSIPHTIHAKVEVIQKMKGLDVPFMASEGPMDDKVEFALKPIYRLENLTRLLVPALCPVWE
jgi:hypothetical protein